MRICSPQLGLDPKSTLGGEVYDREILLGLAKKGIIIDLIVPKGKSIDKNVRNWNTSRLHTAHFPAILANFLFLPAIFFRYKKNNFQILRIHQPQFLGIGAIIFKFFHPQVKLLANYHKFEETLFGPFSGLINKSWDHIICDSEAVKKLIMQKYKISRFKISVVHNGVPSYLKPQKKNRYLTDKFNLKDKIVLLFMGALIPRKAPTFLLDIIKELKLENRKVMLIYVGEGQMKKKIIEQSKKMSIEDNIIILKPLFGQDKNNIHNLADIFLHPSVDEGFALSPLEAMACGKPVIMNNAHSAKEAVIDGYNGFICDNDAKKWIKKIILLSENTNLYNKLKKNCLEKVKHDFTWEKTVEVHLNLFKHL